MVYVEIVDVFGPVRPLYIFDLCLRLSGRRHAARLPCGDPSLLNDDGGDCDGLERASNCRYRVSSPSTVPDSHFLLHHHIHHTHYSWITKRLHTEIQSAESTEPTCDEGVYMGAMAARHSTCSKQ